jgi:para-nitrobenzyl esterase
MRKTLIAMALASLAGGAISMLASPAFADEAAAPAAAHYSVATTKVGKLIDDPAAAAILKQLIPTVWGNEMFQSQGRDLTLKDIQQYEPVLTEDMLAKIQAEFDKIPAKG